MIYHQSVFEKWPFEDNSVQSIITSPPYWGLRKYDIPDVDIDGWRGQYGLEPTFQEYIEHTMLWCKEARRTLKDDGVFFLNLGDSYCNKCLCDIPSRVSIRLVDEQGWIKRNNIIWYKNAVPESVKDRFSKKYEYIFMFTKNTKYYFDLESVKEKAKKRCIPSRNKPYNGKYPDISMYKHLYKEGRIYTHKNPGDIWKISNQPSTEKHYAMWPEKLVERMVLCSTKQGDVVLDPFCGSGTTLRVAMSLGREALGIDLGYKDIQERRLSNLQIKI